MTRPVLSSTKLFTRRPAAPVRPPVDVSAQLADARRSVNQLPLGLSPGPGSRSSDSPRPQDLVAGIDRALWRTASAFGVCVSSTESTLDLARRLVQARAIVPPVAEALAALLPAIEAGAGPDGAHLAVRVVGYLDHRAERAGSRLFR